MKSKKLLFLCMIMFASIFAFTACQSDSAKENTNTQQAEEKKEEKADEKKEAGKKIDDLSIQFVPSRDPEEIITVTEPLKELLTKELANHGYEVGNVDITVGTSYEATGEGLSAGTIDIGFIPGGTYVTYDDSVEVILTATRNGLSIESPDAKVWNDEAPTKKVEDQVTFYRGLVLAGPSEKGKELAAKVNAGEKLTWEDLNSANWAVMGPTSPAGYLYPSLWLADNYNHTISELSNAVQADSYASSFARLASGQLDVLVTYADARIDYIDKWTSEFGASNDIWTDVKVIGVTAPMMNDTISVSETSEKMTPEFIGALQEAFINIGNTPEGKEVIAVYTHNGYEKADPKDYDAERKVQDMIKKAN